MRQLFTASFPGAGAKLLRGEEATKDRLKAASQNSRYLLLATHGFFDPPAAEDSLETPFSVSPLVESGTSEYVDPATGVRDMDIPAMMMRKWRHMSVGVYAEVVAGGSIAVGDAVVPPSAPEATPPK